MVLINSIIVQTRNHSGWAKYLCIQSRSWQKKDKMIVWIEVFQVQNGLLNGINVPNNAAFSKY